ncbi:MAG: hypothetical protein WDM96_03425 [Lacunisphaera sp.]
MPACRYALGEEAVHAFAHLRVKQRGKLLRFFDLLTRQPFQAGDYCETGALGRSYELKLIDDVLVTWWVDHAVREIRIVRIELID